MDAVNDINITGSTVLATIGNDGDADVKLDAGDNITIDPSTVTANVVGDGTALVYMDAGNNIEVLDDSTVSAVVTDDGLAVVSMIAGSDISIDIDSTVKAYVDGDGFAGVLGLAGDDIYADGLVSAVAMGEYGFAGVALLAIDDVYARNVYAYGAGKAIAGIEWLLTQLPWRIPLIDIGAQYEYGSIALIGSLMGNVYLGDVTAHMVMAVALGLYDMCGDVQTLDTGSEDYPGGNIYNYPDDATDTVHAHYLSMLARHNIGTLESPLKTDVSIVSGYSWDIGDIFIHQVTSKLIELGLYLPIYAYFPEQTSGDFQATAAMPQGEGWEQVGAFGASLAANNGIISVTSAGDMVVNSVVAPRGGVHLEATGGIEKFRVGYVSGDSIYDSGYETQDGDYIEDGIIYREETFGASIYAGHGWCPTVSQGQVDGMSEMISSGLACLFGCQVCPGMISEVIGEALMYVGDTQWGQFEGLDYFSPIMVGSSDLPEGPNVIAGGYSYFSAPFGTIGVGSPAGDPGVPGDVTPAEYNPLDVNIQVLDENLGTALNPAGNNSAVPEGVFAGTPPAGLTLVMGDVVPSGYQDSWHGQLGISGAIRGIVRPGVAVNDYTSPVAPLVIPLGGTGYVFYDDVDTNCAGVFEGYPEAFYAGPATGYDITRQIYPLFPDAATSFDLGNLLSLLGDQLKFRIPERTIVENSQISLTQGPISLASNKAQLFFYHPLVAMDMYEVPELGLDVYEFIDGNLDMLDPDLLAGAGLVEDEEEKKLLEEGQEEETGAQV